MKSTILSKTDLEILEKILAAHGSIVGYDSIHSLLKKDYSDQEIRKRVSLLSKRGWLVRIKRGIYAVASLESRNFTGISPIAISNALFFDSYVSMEFALNYRGFLDQLPSSVTAVNTKRSVAYHFQGIKYQFIKTKPELFFGFEEVSLEGRAVKIAEFEKAILDFIYFRSGAYTIDLVLEKLKDAKKSLDFEKMVDYSKVYPLSVKRKLGFLLDLIGVDSGSLHEEVKAFRNFTRLTKKSNIFNAKWRLYYENRFAK